MSIQSEINRITAARDDIASAIEEKGVTLASNSIDTLADGVRAIKQDDSGVKRYTVYTTFNADDWHMPSINGDSYEYEKDSPLVVAYNIEIFKASDNNKFEVDLSKLGGATDRYFQLTNPRIYPYSSSNRSDLGYEICEDYANIFSSSNISFKVEEIEEKGYLRLGTIEVWRPLKHNVFVFWTLEYYENGLIPKRFIETSRDPLKSSPKVSVNILSNSSNWVLQSNGQYLYTGSSSNGCTSVTKVNTVFDLRARTILKNPVCYPSADDTKDSVYNLQKAINIINKASVIVVNGTDAATDLPDYNYIQIKAWEIPPCDVTVYWDIENGYSSDMSPISPSPVANGTLSIDLVGSDETTSVLKTNSDLLEGKTVIDIMKLLIPIGYIFETDPTGLTGAPRLTTSSEVASYFGFGTWEAYGQGRVLIGKGSDGTNSYSVGSTGGAATVALTSSNNGPHSHTRGTMNITGSVYGDDISRDTNVTCTGAFTFGAGVGHFAASTNYNLTNGFNFDASRSWTGATSEEGSGTPHENRQPYIVTYRWRRIG